MSVFDSEKVCPDNAVDLLVADDHVFMGSSADSSSGDSG